MAIQSRSTVRGLVVTALQAIPAIATVSGGALRIARTQAPLAFVLSTRYGVQSETFGWANVIYNFDVFFYVENVLGQEDAAETVLDGIMAEAFANLEDAGFTVGPSAVVPAPGGSALHQLGDRYYRVERLPLQYSQQDRG